MLKIVDTNSRFFLTEIGGVTMRKIPQRRYSKEFQEEAVKFVTEQDLTVQEAVRRLDIPTSTIDHWVRASKAGK